MDGTQVSAQHPHSGVKPLEGGEEVYEEYVARMVLTDMSPFMGEYGGIVGLVITMVHDNIGAEAEWWYIVFDHAERSTIGLRIAFATTYQYHDFPYRQQGMSQRGQYTYYI
jgi:hypothetical protein